MQISRKKLLFWICIAILAIGCSPEVDRDRIIGEYEANHYRASDILEIRADGTYVHRYKEEGSEGIVNTNKWTLEQWQGKPLLIFEGWHPSRTKYPEQIEIGGKKIGSESGRWPVRVEMSVLGKPRLCIDRDLGYFYLKKE
jgi:hypothetical protein